MSSFTYHQTRTRSRSRKRTSPPLSRRTSFKRQRLFSSYSDDGYDDYPYSGLHRPSRAPVQRNAPSQLERWNIWSSPHREERRDSSTEQTSRKRQRRWRVSFADEMYEDEEHTFRLKIARLRERDTRLSPLPARHHAEYDDERIGPPFWSGELLGRRERCFSEDCEARERAQSRSREKQRKERMCHGDDEDKMAEKEFARERLVRYRSVKRTRTEEWRPLVGWRRP